MGEVVENSLKDLAPVIGGVGGAIIGGPSGAMAGYQLGNVIGGKGGGGTNISDSGGMQGYTDLANQASQGYKDQSQFMAENVNPRRKQLLDALAAQAAGTAPSIAEAQLKSAFDKSLQQQLATARSQRTGNAGLASRNVGNMAAIQGQNLAQQSAIARLQEQQAAQSGLQNAIRGEMGYGTDMLTGALTGQKEVAGMQNAARSANDKRNEGIFGAAISMAPKVAEWFAANKGGQIPQYPVAQYAKGGKVKKMNEGGSVSMDMQAADSLLKSKQTAKAPKRTFAQELACGGKAKKMAYGGQYQSDVGNVDEFVKNSQQASQQNSKLGMIPTMPNLSEAPAMIANSGGNVPGNAKKPGDHLENDTVPAILSPGEIVVPRTVVEQGPVAAAHFVKEASKDESYNADTFHAQKKSFAQMLKSIKDDERRYGKVSEILNKKKV